MSNRPPWLYGTRYISIPITAIIKLFKWIFSKGDKK